MSIKLKLENEHKKPILDKSYSFYNPTVIEYGFEFRLYKALTSWRDSNQEDWTVIETFKTVENAESYARGENLKRYKITRAKLIEEEKDQYEIIMSH